jgi:hypothetical protein
MRGCGIPEGTEVEVSIMLEQYVPYVQFEVHPVMPTRLVRKVIKTMPQ